LLAEHLTPRVLETGRWFHATFKGLY
jgi:hypothetical protein